MFYVVFLGYCKCEEVWVPVTPSAGGTINYFYIFKWEDFPVGIKAYYKAESCDGSAKRPMACPQNSSWDTCVMRVSCGSLLWGEQRTRQRVLEVL